MRVFPFGALLFFRYRLIRLIRLLRFIALVLALAFVSVSVRQKHLFRALFGFVHIQLFCFLPSRFYCPQVICILSYIFFLSPLPLESLRLHT